MYIHVDEPSFQLRPPKETLDVHSHQSILIHNVLTCVKFYYSTAKNQANIERAFVTRMVKRAHAFCCVRLRLNFAL